ncbi:MAG: hypothetical protein IPG25_00745 [Proteobacteria bacterium]|nr:hypothetical protein [Pseudomonadota bacterium]
MTRATNPSATTKYLGWAVATLYVAHGLLTTRIVRSDKESPFREELRGYHYLLGFALFILVVWRLLRWWQERPATPAVGVTPAVHHAGRQFALATYLLLACMPLIGLGQAWTEGLSVHLGPLIQVPTLVAANRAGWMFFGYFHSAFGFAITLLTIGSVLLAVWSLLRSGRGLLAAFPPGFGAQAYGSMAVSVYALSSFKAPEPGYRALAIFAAATALVWGAAALIHRRRHAGTVMGMGRNTVGTAARFGSAIATLAFVGVGLIGPYRMFHVTPWPVGETVAGPAGVTSHAAPVMAVTVSAATDFERQVQADTYKWCRFCHTTEQGGKHLVGPNLYAIFGQRAGTVPNFTYSTAMAQAGRDGLVWNDETLDKFLASPSGFVSGTSMIISSGPVRTPAERAAIINILKRETMLVPGDESPR